MSIQLASLSEKLKKEAEKLGVFLAPVQIDEMNEFCSILTKFNEHTNLVASCEAEVLLQDHILDSLSLIGLLKQESHILKEGRASLIDIGSGGGFPGLVLAIAERSLNVTLVESITKKARFLSEAIRNLSLHERVAVLNLRAEVMAHDRCFRHQFDLATARALGSLSMVLELTLPFLKRQGLALIQRSFAQAKQERELSAKALERFRTQLTGIVYPSEEVLVKKRAILLFEQKGLVSKIYPRPWPLPKQNPLLSEINS